MSYLDEIFSTDGLTRSHFTDVYEHWKSLPQRQHRTLCKQVQEVPRLANCSTVLRGPFRDMRAEDGTRLALGSSGYGCVFSKG
jgi:hypothetical protein